jgi:UrcA family protein
MKNMTTVIAAATFAACMFTTAQADSVLQPRSQAVRFSDLATDTVQGAAALYQRINNAAEYVCRDLDPSRALALKEPHVRCVRAALSDAVAAVNRPALTAYARARGVATLGTVEIARRN